MNPSFLVRRVAQAYPARHAELQSAPATEGRGVSAFHGKSILKSLISEAL